MPYIVGGVIGVAITVAVPYAAPVVLKSVGVTAASPMAGGALTSIRAVAGA